MIMLEVTLDLPDRLAREAQAAGLLTPQALSRLLKDAMRRRAGQALLAGAARATASGSRPLTMRLIQTEVNAARRARKARERASVHDVKLLPATHQSLVPIWGSLTLSKPFSIWPA
jgi:hypothetical protein